MKVLLLLLLASVPACSPLQTQLPTLAPQTIAPTNVSPTQAVSPVTAIATATIPPPATVTTATATIPPAATITTAPSTTRAQPTAQPTQVAQSNAPASPRRIRFQPGASAATVQGTLAINAMNSFVLRAFAGQTMTVSVYSNQAHMLLQIAGTDGNPLKTFGAGSSSWSGILPTTQDYSIGIITENGAPATYTLHVSISPLATATPIISQPKRIQFAPGAISATIRSAVAPNAMDRYVLRALAGQTMIVNVSSYELQMYLAIHGADGTVLKAAGAVNWSGRLPTTQDYYLTISTPDGAPASYTLQVTIPQVTIQ
ncbi:MAG: hypothetical protein HZB51_32070 [Chloroflexi bacterium]|nr:hypothetical protein [Chloroflexota bacterium]